MDSLPNEILCQIFAYAGWQMLRRPLWLVCRPFYLVCKHNKGYLKKHVLHRTKSGYVDESMKRQGIHYFEIMQLLVSIEYRDGLKHGLQQVHGNTICVTQFIHGKKIKSEIDNHLFNFTDTGMVWRKRYRYNMTVIYDAKTGAVIRAEVS